MAERRNGVLVIADISGYTRFVGGVELEHGTAIVGDLLGVAVEQLRSIATLAKFEGDAAFCVSAELPRPDSLNAALLGCYDAFRRRLRDARHLTTCTCAACAQMSTLDLKLVAHAGEYLTHSVAGHDEVSGPDVILVHRLLKNSVEAKGYALLTESLVSTVGLPVDGESRTEEVDDVGPVDVRVVDLWEWWRAEQDRSAVVVGADDAVGAMDFELPAPPPVIWEWFSDPGKRARWNLADRIDVEPAGGPSGVGTVNHCVHGKATITEEIVDWKPYRYCTLRVASPVGRFLMTVDVDPVRDDACVAHVRMRPEATGVKRSMWKLAYKAKIRKDFTAGMDRLRDLLAG